MSSYLDDKLGENQSIFDSFIILYISRPVEDDDDDTDVIFEYDYDDGRLYIDKDFIETFSRLFPMEIEESIKFMEDWFKRRYPVKINYVDAC